MREREGGDSKVLCGIFWARHETAPEHPGPWKARLLRADRVREP